MGYSNFGMIEGGPGVVQTILEAEIKPVLVGQDPAFPRRYARIFGAHSSTRVCRA
jgi:hypothetical protein